MSEEKQQHQGDPEEEKKQQSPDEPNEETQSQTEEDQEKDDKNEKVMPFLDHLDELRSRLIRSIVAIFVATLGCYFFSKEIMAFLTRPFPTEQKLIFLAPTEAFVVHLKLALFAGIFVALPYLFYQLWQFVVPGLLEKERKYVPLVVLFSTFFFVTGAAFCYFVIIPFGLNFLLGWGGESLDASITIREYLKFVTMLVLVFGIVFELPLLSFFLTKMGMLTPEFMRKNRRYGIVLTFILAAILTPPDIVTQLFLAGPLLFLYEISILVCKFALKKNDEEENESDSA
ncbi:twin-arginine translocase subunit TatC [candidate division KSB1 bacterium]|nr:twin-arginine translocase subunit TatC [candidate division KSB1 bacterium]